MSKTGYIIAEAIYRIGNLLLTGLTGVFYTRRKKPPEKIAIFRTGNLGDTFCSIPAIRAVRARYPRARYILLTSEKTEGRPHPLEVLKDIIPFDKHILFNISELRNPRYLIRLIKRLRREDIDLLVYLGFSVKYLRILRDTFFYKISGCKSAVGFIWGRHSFFRLSQRRYRCFGNEVERLMEVVRPLGIDPEEIRWEIPRPSHAISLKEIEGRPRIAIHPAAKFPVNRWPGERFVRLIDRLREEADPQLIIIGGPGIVEEGERLQKAGGDRLIDLRGKTDFIELADLLRRCDLLISPDSGPIHVAAAVGTPVVGLYSARDYPGFWYPYGSNHIVLRKDPPCQVCFLTECPTMRCMEEITVDEVVDACLTILSGKGEYRSDTN